MSSSAVVERFRESSDDDRARHRSVERAGRHAPVDRTPIVVGVDGSRESLNAADFAVREARLRQRPMRILYAYGRRPRYVRYETAKVVENVVEHLTVPDGVAVETRVVDGDAAAALLHTATSARLLVVGRHRSGTGAHLLTGTVSSVLSSWAPCPVVIISEDWHPDRYGVGPVVVAVDAGPEDDDILGFAFRRAQLAGVPLVVLHPSRQAGSGIGRWRGFDPAALVDRWRRTYPDVNVTTQYAHDGSAAAITAAWTASLLVVGQPQSLAGPGSWLRSVGYAVVRHTIRPVAVVPRSPASLARVA
ncbi:MAG: universal stress protein [Actinomycetia bacterium]|nr:universal stress protein [Actinomycetes bacterium]